ncbi:MAG: PAS domain-containing protein, partial [Bacteroidetes bacterium]|nr:PAS domain-containing protein [Bacteroidota bacterium]
MMKPIRLRFELRIAFWYAFLGALWISLSDYVLLSLISNPTVLTHIQTYKGWAFVVFSALLILYLIRRERRAHERSVIERKRAESDMADQAKLLNGLLATISEIFWLVDSSGNLLEVNEAYCRMTGYSQEELTALTIHDLDAEENQELVMQKMVEIRKTDSAVFERKHRRKDGEVFDVQISASYWRERDQFFVFIQNITARKRAELALVELESKVYNIIHHSTNLFYSHTPDQVLTFVSPQSRQFLGCEPEEAMRRWTEFVTEHPANQKGLEITERAIETGQAQPPFELELRTMDGRVLWVEVDESPIVENGKTISIVGSLTDITARKKAEDTLRESEESFRALFSNSIDGVALHEIVVNDQGIPVDYIFLRANQAFEKHTGLKVSDIVGKPATQVLPGIEKSNLIEIYGKVALTGEPASFETHVEQLKQDYSISAYQVGHGKFAVVFENITDRVKTEENLERLHMAVENSGEIIFMTDKDGTITYVNPSFTRTYGYTSDEVVGKTTPRILKSGITPPFEYRQLWESITAGRQLFLEITNKTKEGQLRTIESSVNSILDLQGRVNGYLAVQRDVTERKRAEFQVNQLSAAIEQTADIVFITEIDGTIEYTNHAFEQITGYSRAEATGHNASLLSSGEHDTSFFKTFWDTILEGKTSETVFVNRTKAGRFFYHQQTVSPMKDDNGNVIRFISTGRDITENQRVYDLLVEKERLLREAEKIAAIGGVKYDFESSKWIMSEEFTTVLGLHLQAGMTTTQDYLRL